MESGILKKIINFYELHPFPDYDDIDSVYTLIEKSESRIFAKLLNEQIPIGAKVLDAGCGTGQLTNFLSIKGRSVIGVDMSLRSLNLALKFKEKNHLNSAKFYKMNLFKPNFKENSFDFVISNGVLHHTDNPFLGFKTLAGLLKKNGYIIVGLYNKYGRITNDLRGIIIKFFGERALFLDPTVSRLNLKGEKRIAWMMDQYYNPHESRHTINEVLKWFNTTGVEFINSFPKTIFGKNEDYNLFKKHQLGNYFKRLLAQIALIFNKNNEGGFFIMIGRKKCQN